MGMDNWIRPRVFIGEENYKNYLIKQDDARKKLYEKQEELKKKTNDKSFNMIQRHYYASNIE